MVFMVPEQLASVKGTVGRWKSEWMVDDPWNWWSVTSGICTGTFLLGAYDIRPFWRNFTWRSLFWNEKRKNPLL